MSVTISPTGGRLPSVISAIGVALLAGGVVTAVIIRIATTVSVASAAMPVLPERAYTAYTVGPAVPFSDPYAFGNTLVLIAFGAAALGLLVLVAGVALHATRRPSH